VDSLIIVATATTLIAGFLSARLHARTDRAAERLDEWISSNVEASPLSSQDSMISHGLRASEHLEVDRVTEWTCWALLLLLIGTWGYAVFLTASSSEFEFAHGWFWEEGVSLDTDTVGLFVVAFTATIVTVLSALDTGSLLHRLDTIRYKSALLLSAIIEVRDIGQASAKMQGGVESEFQSRGKDNRSGPVSPGHSLPIGGSPQTVENEPPTPMMTFAAASYRALARKRQPSPPDGWPALAASVRDISARYPRWLTARALRVATLGKLLDDRQSWDFDAASQELRIAFIRSVESLIAETRYWRADVGRDLRPGDLSKPLAALGGHLPDHGWATRTPMDDLSLQCAVVGSIDAGNFDMAMCHARALSEQCEDLWSDLMLVGTILLTLKRTNVADSLREDLLLEGAHRLREDSAIVHGSEISGGLGLSEPKSGQSRWSRTSLGDSPNLYLKTPGTESNRTDKDWIPFGRVLESSIRIYFLYLIRDFAPNDIFAPESEAALLLINCTDAHRLALEATRAELFNQVCNRPPPVGRYWELNPDSLDKSAAGFSACQMRLAVRYPM
jgi:hypothetical protein